MRCHKCLGRKEIYRMRPGNYTLENIGGVLIKCPACKATGQEDDQKNLITEEKIDKIRKRNGNIKNGNT